MVTDPIADMLVQIKNASLAGRNNVDVPYSKMKEALAHILVHEGYITNVQVTGEMPRKKLAITLRYENKKPVISDVKRRSRPGFRQYVPKYAIPQVVGGVGTAILSTSAGIMTGKDARKKGIGGELLCVIW